METLILLDLVMAIYEKAVEKTCPATHGRDWWQQVQREVTALIAAETNKDAGEIIDWWHHNWRDYNDTPTRAAGRIRRAAAKLMR